jgi:predicted MFS family arabinose efflux permease
VTAAQTGVGLAGIITFINLYAAQAVLPELAGSFGVSLPATGWAVTASLIAVALVAPFVGSVSDRLGRKRLIVAASWALVVPTALAAAAPSLFWLVLCRFAQGLLLPFIFAVTVAYVGDEAEGAAGLRLAGTYAMGTIFGGCAGRVVAGFVAAATGWRGAFLALAGLTLLAACAITFILPREQRFRPVRGGLGAALRGFGEHLRNRQLLGTYAVGFAVLFSIVCAFTYANFLLAAPPYGMGPAALGSVFLVYLLGLFTTALATRMAVRFGRRPTLVAAVAAGACGLLLTLVPDRWAIIGGLALVAGGVFVEQSLALGFIGVAAARARSTAVGLYVTCYYVGGSLGGVLPAAIWHRFGWPGCVALALVVQVGVLAAALPAWREARA